MASARFWYVPLKQLVPEQAPFAPLLAADVVDESMLADWAPQKLQSRGVAPGDVLALMEGTDARSVARVISITPHSVKWRALPLSQGPDLTSAPNLAEVPANEAAEFRFAVETLLRDVAVTMSAARAGPLKTYTPTGPASNIILYGPPGTGKTHSVRRRALELLGHPDAGSAPHEEIQAEWDRLRRAGQIVFCTFHQAFAYEEFVEGLRPYTDDETANVLYRVDRGIFKQIALTAAGAGVANSEVLDDFSSRWVALTAAIKSNPTYTASGADGGTHLLQVNSSGNITTIQGKVDSASKFTAQGRSYTASRKAMKEIWADREKLGPDPTTTQLADYNTNATPIWIVYRELDAVEVRDARQAASAESPDERARLALASHQEFTFPQDARQYVLVIDEINRANIARVFGELLTLLEPDKRLGSPNELRVQLPASKEWFGVPPNLHVLGTMNTADRSIALMDVALRRRFTFEEMMPDAGALDEALAKARIDEELRKRVVDVFTKLNERLRYLYDREHQIGHAYFFGVRSLADLRAVFADRILPLLQEYFYGQWDKVALALGYPIKADGTPKEVRGAKHPSGTFLTTLKLDEKSVLGFGHDEYVDQVAWDVHPAFRPRGSAPDAWLKQAFDELVGANGA